MLKRHARLMVTLLKIGDVGVAAVAWVAAFYGRYLATVHDITPHPMIDPRQYLSALVLTGLLTLLIFNRFDLYQPKRTKSLWGETGDILRAVVITWLVLYAITNITQPLRPSRILMGSLLLAWMVFAPASRLLARLVLRFARQHSVNLRSAAIVGTGRIAQKLFHRLQANSWTGIEPWYFIGDQPTQSRLLGKPVHSRFDNIDDIYRHHPVDFVFVALSGSDHSRTEEILSQLAKTNADVSLVPDLLGFHFLRFDVSQLENLPIISLTHTPQSGWNSLLKRAFDIAVSSICLAVMAVPMLLIALAIKLTSAGPVFYRQTRTSLGGTPFKILKFRTMVDNAEQDTGPVWAIPDDPRVTPLGRFLRRTSLDELPQLINVLLGQMSMVGPRPERPELVERFRRQVPRYMLRQQVKAGLTGWAQVCGLRGHTSLRKRVQYDVYYIMNWSFGLDLRILLVTPFRGLLSRNAY